MENFTTFPCLWLPVAKFDVRFHVCDFTPWTRRNTKDLLMSIIMEISRLFPKSWNLTAILCLWLFPGREIWRQISCLRLSLGYKICQNIWRQPSNVSTAQWNPSLHRISMQLDVQPGLPPQQYSITFGTTQTTQLTGKIFKANFGEKSWNFPWILTSIFKSLVSLLGHGVKLHTWKLP